MTAADRLRAAVEAALVCSEHPSGHIEACEACSWFATASSAALAAALPIVEELERDRERLRAVLEWAGAKVLAMTPTPWARHNVESTMLAALARDWPAVRAAGVSLPGEVE